MNSKPKKQERYAILHRYCVGDMSQIKKKEKSKKKVMDARDLMFGDWVTLNGVDYKWQCTDHDFTASEVNTLEPIHLTPEILEKNGWKELEWNDVKYHPGLTTAYKNDDYIIQIGYNEFTDRYDIFNGVITFCYVHELQNVFRICRLKELADNFKL